MHESKDGGMGTAGCKSICVDVDGGSTGKPMIQGPSVDTLKIIGSTQLAIDPPKLLEIFILGIARSLSILILNNRTQI